MNYFDKTNTSHFLLNPIRSFIEDPDVSEILINKPQEIWVEKYGDLKPYTVNEMDLSRMRRVFRLLSAENKQEPSIGKDNPMLSGSLLDGSRVQLVHPPVAGHFTLSIRRKTVLNRTLEDYSNDNYYQHMEYADIDDNFISEQDQHLLKLYNAKDWDSFIYYALKYKKNIVLSGATSSGKTTYLNALIKAIDLADRIITLEDTREIEAPHPNQVNLVAKKLTSANEYKQIVNFQDLIQACLRLRPDRIIMGEIRGKEIIDFISAASTGHEGALTTIHANSPRVAFMRMVQMYKLNNVPSMTDQDILREIKSTVDIVIQINKSKDKGRYAQSIYFKHANQNIFH
ncbi:P-type DNA transfer ATPase VirB11 [Allofrancisella guangzhouensis]|uniref:P-type DNA transfer ATPase VirB11 n=1 Tax=Allofrancisella guangzhouensis TaxID=594679 RepID=UPI001906C213|nr:P-type DNA transfer ATPase VirB11 [Allofrancisella guangzhouensis]MBK2046051.1 P-type DNA transfer ATPase VirB11 [Allofrancisella guangzhouensis]